MYPSRPNLVNGENRSVADTVSGFTFESAMSFIAENNDDYDSTFISNWELDAGGCDGSVLGWNGASRR
jgi:hypothetical protein